MNIPIAILIGAICFFVLGATFGWYVCTHRSQPIYGAILFSVLVAAPGLFRGAAIMIGHYSTDAGAKP